MVAFAAIHSCTLEPVEGDARVHFVIHTTDNPDGTTAVHIRQQTHGSQLLGAVSGDTYVFNESQDVVQSETISGSSGRVMTRTIFVHNGEQLAYLEEPGLDDLHQHMTIVFSPLLPPEIRVDRTECR